MRKCRYPSNTIGESPLTLMSTTSGMTDGCPSSRRWHASCSWAAIRAVSQTTNAGVFATTLVSAIYIRASSGDKLKSFSIDPRPATAAGNLYDHKKASPSAAAASWNTTILGVPARPWKAKSNKYNRSDGPIRSDNTVFTWLSRSFRGIHDPCRTSANLAPEGSVCSGWKLKMTRPVAETAMLPDGVSKLTTTSAWPGCICLRGVKLAKFTPPTRGPGKKAPRPDRVLTTTPTSTDTRAASRAQHIASLPAMAVWQARGGRTERINVEGVVRARLQVLSSSDT
mmetsp:Transcript_107074/g.341710  ORF Transcript_107074/g.341710 Transcript_107074/m.341710 type:complete len:283 (-) Transcript_107074:2-850(-)